MKEDERRLWAALRDAHQGPHNQANGSTPREVIASLEPPIPHKRARYILEKWSGRGWYDYGVSIDLGWLTPEGWARDTDVAIVESRPGGEE